MESTEINWKSLWTNEDWWANWLGFTLFILVYLEILSDAPRPSLWVSNPFSSLTGNTIMMVLALMIGLVALFSIGIWAMGGNPRKYVPAFIVIFIIGYIAQIIAGQRTLKTYGFEYVFWALFAGILIRNLVGLPDWLKHAVKTELYIKTGLVLLGAEILFPVIVKGGVVSLLQSLFTVMVVWYFCYFFAQKVGRSLQRLFQ